VKVILNLTLFDDESVRAKLKVMSRLEAAFDDARNTIPDEFLWFADELPFGATMKITIETVDENN
jgi:hypothetical protein